MKLCVSCKTTKDLSCFKADKKTKDKLSSWCKECYSEYTKKRYYSNLQYSRNKTNQRRADRVKWHQDLKRNKPCIDCGCIYEPHCMDYDHIPEKGTKIKSVSRMVLQNAPFAKILEEINKCELVCVLCHNKRTYDRMIQKFGEKRSYNIWANKNIQIINNFKNKECNICNKKYDLYNMQIDHIDPSQKICNVSQLKRFKTKLLLLELEKCQVVCALCHRDKSIKEQQEGYYKVVKQELPEQFKKKKAFLDTDNNLRECLMCYKIKDISTFNIKSNNRPFTYCKECFNQYKRSRRKNKK